MRLSSFCLAPYILSRLEISREGSRTEEREEREGERKKRGKSAFSEGSAVFAARPDPCSVSVDLHIIIVNTTSCVCLSPSVPVLSAETLKALQILAFRGYFRKSKFTEVLRLVR